MPVLQQFPKAHPGSLRLHNGLGVAHPRGPRHAGAGRSVRDVSDLQEQTVAV
jgi:hypothetical protein